MIDQVFTATITCNYIYAIVESA